MQEETQSHVSSFEFIVALTFAISFDSVSFGFIALESLLNLP